MTITVAPSNDQVQQCLYAFLTGFLPSTVPVIEGQDNRVAEPSDTDFVVITPIRRTRLITNNIDDYRDAVFTGSITDDVMTITDTLYGPELTDGAVIFGIGVAANTTIVATVSATPDDAPQPTGGLPTGAPDFPGTGVGTYKVSPGNQNVPPGTVLAAGTLSAMQEMDIVYQIDVHGAVSGSAADNAQTIATLFQDQYGIDSFGDTCDALGFDRLAVTPMYCDVPQQRPFLNENQQIEYRWGFDCHIQANQVTLNIPQEFAAAFDVNLIPVDVYYPPEPVLT